MRQDYENLRHMWKREKDAKGKEGRRNSQCLRGVPCRML